MENKDNKAGGCACGAPRPAPQYPDQVTGMYVLARALRMVGVDTMYGLVGIPVTEVAYIAQEQGIRFVSFRHEQNAGMAAQTHGFLTGKPGVLLTVSSLGFLNGLTATANATVNCYPMIQISGSSVREPIDLDQGTYEGLDQLAIARPLVKAAYRVNNVEDPDSCGARLPRCCKRTPWRRLPRHNYTLSGAGHRHVARRGTTLYSRGSMSCHAAGSGGH